MGTAVGEKLIDLHRLQVSGKRHREVVAVAVLSADAVAGIQVGNRQVRTPDTLCREMKLMEGVA